MYRNLVTCFCADRGVWLYIVSKSVSTQFGPPGSTILVSDGVRWHQICQMVGVVGQEYDEWVMGTMSGL